MSADIDSPARAIVLATSPATLGENQTLTMPKSAAADSHSTKPRTACWRGSAITASRSDSVAGASVPNQDQRDLLRRIDHFVPTRTANARYSTNTTALT